MMNIRANTGLEHARQTLEIIEEGRYTLSNWSINISRFIKNSVENTVLYSPDSLEKILSEVSDLIKNIDLQTEITVQNCTAMEAARELITDGKTGCLNFASAIRPGQGFREEGYAQEQSLIKASALYPTLIKYSSEMYEYNQRRNTDLYSDYMIYSPDVIFFKDDNANLLPRPFTLNILTSPAVNIRGMKKNHSKELIKAESVMIGRIDKILSVFLVNKMKNLVLGAWGCGLSQNAPENIAQYFSHFLTKGGKYHRCFKRITFAVLDESKDQGNFLAFKNTFS